MDAVEQWLRDRATGSASEEAHDVITELADTWADRPPVALLPYQGDRSPLEDFLEKVDGPVMIGLDPVIYPACTTCGWAWMMRRVKGVWAWYPDCKHKRAACKLVKTT